MSVSRDRKDASKALGIALQIKYRQLVEANGEEDIQAAAIALGVLFNENIEQIIWFLKEYGGVNQIPLERRPAALPVLNLPT